MHTGGISRAPVGPDPAARESTLDPGALGELLELLRDRDGLDLTGYRRATLARRIQNRMISAGAATLADYVALLRADRGEGARLLERLTIKVSRFYRNGESAEAVARALAAERARAPRRLTVWSAGCGRGEEPYTLAMILDELGQREDGAPSVVATDIDPGALAAALGAVYRASALEEVPARARSRHFRPGGTFEDPLWRVDDGIRGRVRFERHDLARAEAPPRGGPFDLVVCRNTLIYFDPPLQRRATALLCRGLAPGGLLWLGEAEWPVGDVASRLRTVDRRARLFRLAPEGDAHAP